MLEAHPVINAAVDPQSTTPATQPTIPLVADLIPARIRAWIYALLGPVITLTLMIRTGADPIDIALAIGGALGFGVAFSNVPRRV